MLIRKNKVENEKKFLIFSIPKTTTNLWSTQAVFVFPFFPEWATEI